MSRPEAIQMLAGAALAAAGVFLAFGAAPAMIVIGVFLVLDAQLEQLQRRRGGRAG